MSYILEALKKSEQERRRSQVPDLQTEHTPPPERGRKKRLWPFLILAALLLNAALFTWWLRPWSTPEPLVQELALSEESVVVSEPSAASPQPIDPSPPSRQAESATNAPPDASASSPPTASATPSPPTNASPPVSEPTAKTEIVQSLPRMEELPHSLRREIPEIAISLHYYTDSPTARMVRINGRNLRENQRIDENLMLQEITEEGVVLDFKGQAFTFRKL